MTTISNVFLARLQRQPRGAPRPRHHRLRESPRLPPKVPLLPLGPPLLPLDPPARPHRRQGLQPQALDLVPVLGQRLTPRLKQHWPN